MGVGEKSINLKAIPQKINKHQFSAKVLLFGEYCILLNGSALAIPINLFSASLKNDKSSCDLTLNAFCQYLKSSPKLKGLINLDLFETQIQEGLCIESNIPIGYGMGSSGAITAAVYEKFSYDTNSKDIDELKAIFAEMESFFHGISSGIDPIVSYKKKYVLNEPPNHLSHPKYQIISLNNYLLILIDSKTSRKTVPLVKQFKSWLDNPEYKKEIEEVLMPLNKKAIEQFLQNKEVDLFKSFGQISKFQWSHMKNMICPGIEAIWEAGLASNDFYLKLCGAGGGGMYLGMVKKNKLALLPHEFPIIQI